MKEHVTAASSRSTRLVRIEDGAYAHVVLLPTMLRASPTSATATAPSPPTSSTAPCARSAASTTCSARVRRSARSTRLDPPVRAALRLGAYQLLHDTPPHAAVGVDRRRGRRRVRRARGGS